MCVILGPDRPLHQFPLSGDCKAKLHVGWGLGPNFGFPVVGVQCKGMPCAQGENPRRFAQRSSMKPVHNLKLFKSDGFRFQNSTFYARQMLKKNELKTCFVWLGGGQVRFRPPGVPNTSDPITSLSFSVHLKINRL